MKHYLAIGLGVLLLLAPLWTISGYVTLPEYRTGTIADFGMAICMTVTLYGGVFAGLLVHRLYGSRASKEAAPLMSRFVAGMAGAAGAITLALIIIFAAELISTGRLMRPGQSPALLPLFYVVGGFLSAFIAGGAALISYGLSRPTR